MSVSRVRELVEHSVTTGKGTFIFLLALLFCSVPMIAFAAWEFASYMDQTSHAGCLLEVKHHWGLLIAIGASLSSAIFMAVQLAAMSRARLKAASYLNSALELSMDGLVIVSSDGTILKASRAMEGVTGLASEDLVGQQCNVLHHHSCPVCLREQVKNSPERLQQERVMTVNGEERVFRETVMPYLEEGDCCGFIAVYHDITALRAETTAAVLARDFYQNLFRSFPALVRCLDIEGNCNYANDAWLRFVYHDPGRAGGRNWLERVHPDDRNSLQEIYKEAINARASYCTRYRLLHHDGSYRWISDQCQPLNAPDGGFLGFIMMGLDIDDQLRLERELLESRAQAQNMIEHANVLVVGLDLDANIIIFNKEAEQVTGYSKQEAIGANWYDLFSLDSEEGAARYHAAIAADTLPESYQGWIKTKTGTELEISWNISAIKKERDLAGVLSFGLDVTQLVKAHRALAESELRYRSIMEQAGDGIFLKNFDGCYLELNDSACTILGYSREQLLGMKDSQIYTAEFEQVRDGIYSALRAGDTVSREAEVVRADGELRRIESVSRAAMENLIVVTVRDITERRRTEQALHNSELFLKEAQRIGRIGCYTIDLADMSCDCSEMLADILGLSGAGIYDKETWFAVIDPEQQPALVQAIEDSCRDKRRMQIDIRIKRASDGDERWLACIGEPVIGAGGSALSLRGTITDVTERRAEAAALEQARDAALASVRVKSEFLTNMSHELRTPLHGMIGMTELTLDTELSAEQREYLQMARQSAELLLNLLNSLLDISRLESGRLELHNENFSLDTTLTATLNSLKAQAKVKEIDFTCQLTPDMPPILHGDPVRICQVLMNLAGNGIKFTGSGSVAVTVSMRSHDAQTGLLRFMVHDTGIGVSPGFESTLFEPFTQADSSITRRFGGSGLGLAISKHLTELMGGRIWLESTGPGGSCFAFEVPVRMINASTAFLSNLVAAEVPSSDGLEGVKVLVVEDNEVNLVFMQSALAKYGLHVCIARNGAEGLDALRREKVDLVFADIEMPVKNGYQMMAELRSGVVGELNRNVPLIALTAHGMDGDKERCLASGATDYLTKPVSISELAGYVSRYSCLEGTSWRRLQQQADDDPETLRIFMETMLSAFPEEMARVTHDLVTRDGRRLLKSLHTLKGGALTGHLDFMAELAGKGEMAALACDWQQLEIIFASLEKTWAAAEQKIKDKLAQLAQVGELQ